MRSCRAAAAQPAVVAVVCLYIAVSVAFIARRSASETVLARRCLLAVTLKAFVHSSGGRDGVHGGVRRRARHESVKRASGTGAGHEAVRAVGTLAHCCVLDLWCVRCTSRLLSTASARCIRTQDRFLLRASGRRLDRALAHGECCVAVNECNATSVCRSSTPPRGARRDYRVSQRAGQGVHANRYGTFFDPHEPRLVVNTYAVVAGRSARWSATHESARPVG